MFNIEKHRQEYFYDYVTSIDNIISENMADTLAQRVNDLIVKNQVNLVDHEGFGNKEVADMGGKYLHHIFKGDDMRLHFPEIQSIYTVALPLITVITSQDVVLSPYPISDINIKAYPKGGGTLGKHYDTNAITALLFLTTNQEAPLRMYIERKHPSKPDGWTEEKHIFAKKGSLFLLQGREILHDCAPTKTEQKLTVVLNYYTKNDTYRNEKFDDFVYYGKSPQDTT